MISQEKIENLTPHLKKSCDSIFHRGPDDSGTEVFDRAFLGFRRLAIIDLSQNGHQPMRDDSGRYWIIFNGEIYNFLDIKKDLIARGYSFRSGSDTEVILNGYIAFGSKIVSVLEGMFSFIIYDKKQHTFFAARDRMGKKPMLIYQNGESTFLFSELKQILNVPGFDKEVNYSGIKNYLTYGSFSQPATIFQSVTCLPPGHFLTIEEGELKIEMYWQPDFSLQSNVSYHDAKDQIRYLVEGAVRKRMISDVPLGAFLSGGIDSSIIVGLMRKFASGTVKTFSISYADSNPSFDESVFANLIAKRFETDHHVIEISPANVTTELDRIIWNMDQPSCDAINTYFVSKSARQGVTVALSGVGADELFAGYSTFKFVNLANQIRKSKTQTSNYNRIVTDLFQNLPPSISASWKLRGAFTLLGAFPRTIDRYNLIKQIYYPSDTNRLLSEMVHSLIYNLNDSVIKKYFDTTSTDLQKISSVETCHYLINTLLRDTDVMGMAHSLEIRAPFIDHYLIEFASTLPDNFKIQNLSTKLILKDAFVDILPEDVIKRKKMGFAFPLAIWLKKGNLKEIVEETLSEESVQKRGWLNPVAVRKQKQNFFNIRNETPNSFQAYQRVWTLVVLELWARRFLDVSY